MRYALNSSKIKKKLFWSSKLNLLEGLIERLNGTSTIKIILNFLKKDILKRLVIND